MHQSYGRALEQLVTLLTLTLKTCQDSVIKITLKQGKYLKQKVKILHPFASFYLSDG